MPACENEDSTSKVQWGGALRIHTDRMALLKTPTVPLSFPATVLFKGPEYPREKQGQGSQTPFTQTGMASMVGLRLHQQGPCYVHLRLFLHLTQVRPHPSWRGRSSAVCSSGNDLLFQPHPYEHHHFWASRMLYLSITIATHTTSLRAVGFILWRRKYGRELMPMKSPDYHMPHRQAHPAGCGLVPLHQAVRRCHSPRVQEPSSAGCPPANTGILLSFL